MPQLVLSLGRLFSNYLSAGHSFRLLSVVFGCRRLDPKFLTDCEADGVCTGQIDLKVIFKDAHVMTNSSRPDWCCEDPVPEHVPDEPFDQPISDMLGNTKTLANVRTTEAARTGSRPKLCRMYRPLMA